MFIRLEGSDQHTRMSPNHRVVRMRRATTQKQRRHKHTQPQVHVRIRTYAYSHTHATKTEGFAQGRSIQALSRPSPSPPLFTSLFPYLVCYAHTTRPSPTFPPSTTILRSPSSSSHHHRGSPFRHAHVLYAKQSNKTHKASQCLTPARESAHTRNRSRT